LRRQFSGVDGDGSKCGVSDFHLELNKRLDLNNKHLDFALAQ
jgi:hypothetical protein